MKRHDTISVTAATARFFPYGNPAYTVSPTRNHLTGERLGMKLERKEPTGSKRNHRELAAGIALLSAFAIWTALVQIVDVQPVGPESTDVGFATLNIWFHQATGVHLQLYTLTDHLSLIPLIACLCFCIMGTIQLTKHKSLLKVDCDLLALGTYCAAIATAFLLFETFPVNYRPILIESALEASYPSSTTLLVLSIMPALNFQVHRRAANPLPRAMASVLISAFSVFMIAGRLLSGVHWTTDIIGSMMLAKGIVLARRA